MECFKCGISGEKATLYDVITKEGIIKLCDNCSRKEDSPVIRKPTVFQLKEIERSPTVYERLSKVAGIDLRGKKSEKKEDVITADTNLRLLVDKNYTEKTRASARSRSDLTDNFHWLIMRARRNRKLTQKQFAEAIGEPEAAIKLAEERVMPDDNKLLNKIESYLKIDLSKEGKKSKENSSAGIEDNQLPEKLSDNLFEQKNSDRVTISDLRKINTEKNGMKSEKSEKNEEKTKDSRKDLTDDDIHDLIFKKGD